MPSTVLGTGKTEQNHLQKYVAISVVKEKCKIREIGVARKAGIAILGNRITGSSFTGNLDEI